MSAMARPASLALRLDGRLCHVPAGITVAAALHICGDGCARVSVSGQRRAPLCGMGVCQECRVLIDGQLRLACQTLCRSAMAVCTVAPGQP